MTIALALLSVGVPLNKPVGGIFNSLLAAVDICGCNLGVQTSYPKEVIVSVMGPGGISPH